MTDIIKNLQNIKSLIDNSNVNVIAVTKTFSLDYVRPLLNLGHIHFGENKVQEAKIKWSNIKELNSEIKLHMIGKLQKNKAKDAIKLFDYIHSVDNEDLANELAKYESQLNKKKKYFIQLNLANEEQKSGISLNKLEDFYFFCKNLKLDIIGLMCIPPNDNNSSRYFLQLQRLSKSLGLKDLSMGMSNDFLNAVKCGSTFIRLGTAIFGSRETK